MISNSIRLLLSCNKLPIEKKIVSAKIHNFFIVCSRTPPSFSEKKILLVTQCNISEVDTIHNVFVS